METSQCNMPQEGDAVWATTSLSLPHNNRYINLMAVQLVVAYNVSLQPQNETKSAAGKVEEQLEAGSSIALSVCGLAWRNTHRR